MRMIQFSVAVFSILLALSLLRPVQVHSAEKESVPLSAIPTAVKEKAKKEFTAGNKCYIWKDEKTTLQASQLPFGGMFLIFGPFKVLSSPDANDVEFQSYFSFVVLNEDKKSGEQVAATLVNESVIEKASNSEGRTFMVLLPTVMNDKKYSGRATTKIFLKARTGDKSTISNNILFDVDFDAGKIVRWH
jgi:hypothetical protein